MSSGRVVALSGGVGGAKLSLGLSRVLPPEALSIVVNTGDDFDHLGLRISPDVDTTVYTLAGLVNPETGWGRANETWTFMQALAALGGETWFRLGDADLAMHVERTRRLAAGETLGAITADMSRRLGVAARVLPMTDDEVRTRVVTPEGVLDFQEYFVRLQCRPVVQALRFDGAQRARPAAGVIEALTAPDLRAIVVCPSNPYLSIDPILAVPGMRELLRAAGAPVVAVSPLIGGRAVKGPTDKIMGELGIETSPVEIARHYEGLIDAMLLDTCDAAVAGELGIPCRTTDTLMKSLEDRERVARAVLDLAAEVARPGGPTP